MVNIPGSCTERLVEMRYRRKLTQQDLSKELQKNGYGYFDVSTISRAESGKTSRINAELIEALAKYYDVTADYLLGLTDIPDKKNYELSELGLSYEAALSLIRKDTDPKGLNLLFRCEGFSDLCDMAASYFSAESREVYDDLRLVFPDLTGLPDDAGDFGYALSESDRRKLKADLAVLKEPERWQKETIIKQFEVVTEELAENMKERPDPEQLSHESNELKLQLKKEVLKRQRQLKQRMITEEDMAVIMATIAARKMRLHDDERQLFEQLYLTMIRNRSKKNGKEVSDKIQTHDRRGPLYPL